MVSKFISDSQYYILRKTENRSSAYLSTYAGIRKNIMIVVLQRDAVEIMIEINYYHARYCPALFCQIYDNVPMRKEDES